MLAGIVAALLGPEVGQRYSAVDGLPLYVGSFLGLAGLLDHILTNTSLVFLSRYECSYRG